MKKDGIQTRNRKLNAKKKKKCNMLVPGGSGGFGGFGAHGGYMYGMYGSNHFAAVAASLRDVAAAGSSSMAGSLMGPGGQVAYHGHQHHPSMHGMSGLGLSGASAAAGAPMGLGGGFCTVGA